MKKLLDVLYQFSLRKYSAKAVSSGFILTEEPQKHRNSTKFLIRKFSPLQSFLFEIAKHFTVKSFLFEKAKSSTNNINFFLFLIRFKIGRAHFVPCAISCQVNDIKIEKFLTPAKIYPLVYNIGSRMFFYKQIVVSLQVTLEFSQKNQSFMLFIDVNI